jgi:adenosine 3'-phospho 5'-phosphosulfate transporter B2
MLEYIEAGLITTGVAMFTYGDTGERKNPKHIESESDGGEFLYYGIALLGLYLLCDSFTSQWQSRVYKQFGIDQYQMMLGVNVWSMMLTFFTLIQSGEFFSSIAFILADSSALLNMTVLSITSATGQLFIFYTIKELGPVMFTIIMTTRQLFSLFLSCLLFSHPLSWVSFFSAVFVFLIVFGRIYRKGTD